MTHTPTPWHTHYEQSCITIEFERDNGHPRPSRPYVAWIGFGRNGVGTLIDEANAAFIVRACNSHDELLSALRLCVAALADHLQYDEGKSLERDAHNAAVEAIAKAT